MHLLLLGDSLFARHEGKDLPHIEYSLRQLVPDVTITNWAVSGDNSFDLLRQLASRTLPTADWVLVFIGANDLAQHKQVFLGEYEDNLKKIVAHLNQAFPDERLVLLTPSPVDETKQAYRTNRLVAYYGQVVKKVAEQAGCQVLDTVALFEGSQLALPDLLRGSLDDGLHFGSQAYDLLAKELVARLTTD